MKNNLHSTKLKWN